MHMRNKSFYCLPVLIALISCPVDAGQLADTVKSARISGGVIVLVNGSDEVYKDAAATNCTVHGLETDGKRIGALRTRLKAAGQYGKVSVSGFNGTGLSYIDNLINPSPPSHRRTVTRNQISYQLY